MKKRIFHNAFRLPSFQASFSKKGIVMLKRSLSLLVFACGVAAVFGILLGGSSVQAQTTYYWTTGPASSPPVYGNGALGR